MLAGVALGAGRIAQGGGGKRGAASEERLFVRLNQLGYVPRARKVAVLCALDSLGAPLVRVADSTGRTVVRSRARPVGGRFAGCRVTYHLDLSSVSRRGEYRVEVPGAMPATLSITDRPNVGLVDSLLIYLRQQRSGWNPLFRDSVHTRDGFVIDDSGHALRFHATSGGWADASDYLQYVATSANAVYVLLAADRDFPGASGDAYAANGLPGANGVADVVDEARHGLDWLLRMFPSDSELFNQLGDDRDHAYLDLPLTDSSDYGWGKGRERPIYRCTGRPQGLFGYRNRSTGMASTAGKMASAFAIGAQVFKQRDSALASLLRARAVTAYSLGLRAPGVCQTAPARAPYFYEEENWVDDMELAAAELYTLTRDEPYRGDALRFAAQEAVTPWMGADTANHYQWYPFFNFGHYALSRATSAAERTLLAGYYRRGLEAVIGRAGNGFRVGVPFVWCSSNLVSAFATQAYLYRRMTGDTRFLEYETAAIDWLFGRNPWGVSMVVGLGSRYALDPHSVVAKQLGIRLTGALLDGPVYRSIFANLRGISLHEPDEFAPINSGAIVYHDDMGDYSTNEPTMDGTASLAYLAAALASGR